MKITKDNWRAEAVKAYNVGDIKRGDAILSEFAPNWDKAQVRGNTVTSY